MLDSILTAPKRRLGRSSRSVRQFVSVLIALLCALLAWELILRQTLLNSPRHLVHPQLGMIFEPGRYLQGSEGFCSTRINSLGMRYGEITPKAAGAYRIMALGDSYTEGFQVADDRTFCARLERRLATATGRTVEIVNAGREGGSPVDYIQLGSFYTELLQPDLAIVQLNERDFTHDLFNTSQSYHLVERADGFTVGTHNALGNPLEEFGRRIPQIAPVMGLSTLRMMAKKVHTALKPAAATAEDAQADTPAALLRTARAIDWVVEGLRDAYPGVILVMLPTLDYTDLPRDRPSFVEVQLANACAIRRVPLISMREPFTAHFLRTHQPSSGFNNTTPGSGHINDTGHRLTADALAEYLLATRMGTAPVAREARP